MSFISISKLTIACLGRDDDSMLRVKCTFETMTL